MSTSEPEKTRTPGFVPFSRATSSICASRRSTLRPFATPRLRLWSATPK